MCTLYSVFTHMYVVYTPVCVRALVSTSMQVKTNACSFSDHARTILVFPALSESTFALLLKYNKWFYCDVSLDTALEIYVSVYLFGL